MKPTEPAAGHDRHDPDALHNVGVAHEHSDINVRAILMFLVGLAAVGIAVHVLMWALFIVFENQAAANDPPISPTAVPATQMPATTTGSPAFGSAPGPQLLTNEPEVLRQFRASEEQRLGQYGWVDQQAGVARMPIGEAKKLLVERGVPARDGGSEPGRGTRLPAYGEASSGRAVTGSLRGAGLPELNSEPTGPAQKTPTPQKGSGP